MSRDKVHIAILCSRLDQPGGTERAIVNLANLMASHGHPVTLVVLDDTEGLFYTIRDSISVVYRKMDFGITPKGNFISRKRSLYRDVQQLKKLMLQIKPDFVIGSEYHLTITGWLASRKLDLKVFAWEHHHLFWIKKNRFWTFLFRTIYPKLDAVVCQNETEKKLYDQMDCRAIVIPYSLQDKKVEQASLDTPQLLTVGWLIRRKGVDLIPSIAEKLASQFPQWKWKIIGRGEEYEELKKLIHEKNLSGFLTIQAPLNQDLEQEYLGSSIYVMTSRFECLPMVLLEAGSHGLPAVAFDCPTGPADIIRNEKDGYLIPLEDVEGMANALASLMANEEKRKAFGSAALGGSKRYSAERIYEMWGKALANSN